MIAALVVLWLLSLSVFGWGVRNVLRTDNSDAAAIAAVTLFPGTIFLLITLIVTMLWWNS